ncbi:hypothetical protein [Azospirillum sp. sgz301742]
MWQTYVQALFSALACSGMAFGIAKLVVIVGERMIEKRHGTVGIRDMLVRRARLETGLEARRGQRHKEIKAADDEAREVLRRRSQLERQISDTLRDGERIIHLIGEELKGTPCFHAQVLNKYVGSAAQHQNSFIDPRWAQPQSMEVWAPTVSEARKMIEGRYPPAFGYKIVTLHEVGGLPYEQAAGSGKAA